MEKTIAAIATGMQPSGISIIRISGKDAIPIADRLFVSPEKKHILKNAASHTIHYGYILSPEQEDTADTKTEDKDLLDEVLVSVMKGPKSYTGEDVVEINCHGGILVTRMILDAVLHAGASLAAPGEFTKRAFLSGRIDLSEAEAVMDLIDAKSRAAVKNSEKQLRGQLKNKIISMRDRILHETAYIESALDDPEHFDLTDYPKQLSAVIVKLLAEANNLLESATEGAILKTGIRSVILGKPNVGKSTLLNLLSGQNKAIVTDIAGTTRDTIEENLTIRDIPFVMIDTAGIRDTEDMVEKIGVDRAKEAAKEADLVLYLLDASSEFDEQDLQILHLVSDKKVILLLNKSDLPARSTVSDIEEKLSASFSSAGNIIRVLPISAKENQGIEELKDLAQDLFFGGKLKQEEEIFITNARHREALFETIRSLELVQKSIAENMPEDFYSIDLMDAYSFLGRIIGCEVEDDLVEKIFSEFCMGK